MIDDTSRIEKILKEYDLKGDRGKDYREYYEDIFEECYEKNTFHEGECNESS